MMPIGIRPTVDLIFKLMFGSPEHSRITIHFLNAVLGNVPQIRQVTFQNPFLDRDSEDEKLSVLDILATDEHGRIVNIEMQTSVPAGTHQRVTYYACWVYSDQLIAGDPYTSLRPVISICVLTTPMLSNVCELHLEFSLRTATGVKLTDDLQVHLLQLSNLTVTAQNVPTAAPIEQWAYFLLNVEHLALDEVKRLFPDPVFTEAAGVLEMVSKSPEQRHQYDARVKFQRDEAARLEQARNEGIEQGIEQGIERGRREGELLGQIKLLQQLVGIAVPTPVELLSFNEVQLSELAEQMKRQLRTRGE